MKNIFTIIVMWALISMCHLSCFSLLNPQIKKVLNGASVVQILFNYLFNFLRLRSKCTINLNVPNLLFSVVQMGKSVI